MTPDSSSPAPANAALNAQPVGAEARREQRTKVSWPARVQLPNGKVVELRVRDISEGGLGLVSGDAIPAHSVLTFAMGVPGQVDPKKITAVTGTIKTAYLVLHGNDFQVGAMWVDISDESRELISSWIRRLRR